jgi:RNA polymerase sigma factor (sigma-70 family)
MTAETLVIDERDASPDAPIVATSELIATVRAARTGDQAAFEELMQRTERKVARIAWSILGDAEEVRDAMQETFLRFFRHLHQYDEQHDLSAWLSRIAVNVCRDALRRRKRRKEFEPLDERMIIASNERGADEELIRRGEVALLHRAIDALAPRERMAVLLRDVEGMPTNEVAAALGNSVATVRVQLCRARIKLRRFVEAWAGGKKP